MAERKGRHSPIKLEMGQTEWNFKITTNNNLYCNIVVVKSSPYILPSCSCYLLFPLPWSQEISGCWYPVCSASCLSTLLEGWTDWLQQYHTLYTVSYTLHWPRHPTPYHYTISLHLITAPYHCTISLHRITTPYHCTVSLHKTLYTAQYTLHYVIHSTLH